MISPAFFFWLINRATECHGDGCNFCDNTVYPASAAKQEPAGLRYGANPDRPVRQDDPLYQQVLKRLKDSEKRLKDAETRADTVECDEAIAAPPSAAAGIGRNAAAEELAAVKRASQLDLMTANADLSSIVPDLQERIDAGNVEPVRSDPPSDNRLPNPAETSKPAEEAAAQAEAPAGDAPAAKPTFCSQCGTTLGGGVQFCSECGAAVEAKPAAEAAAPAEVL